MRPIKEILQVILDLANHEQSIRGLCNLAIRAESMGFITMIEYCRLELYIDSNRPKWYTSWDAFTCHVRKDPYYWPMGKKEPRIKWLKYHINKK